MPRIEARRLARKMAEIGDTIPKHIQKSLAKRLAQLSTDEWIDVTVPAEIRVSCIWDEGDIPTLDFCELEESLEDMLEDASDYGLKELGLSSIVEFRERIQKEITEWINEIERLEKAYSIDENLLADFFIGGHYGGK